ncbi:unnamed protein product [Phytophthora fragariaefolia]|uniref:Unnamed protein product n=1 Tax=Phytophthora fragariaefolia TaxID=1490495 RepID=A0A9W6TXG8_9STRA|nr:unnamed protein product [Phytophthora fragariaefolia]
MTSYGYDLTFEIAHAGLEQLNSGFGLGTASSLVPQLDLQLARSAPPSLGRPNRARSPVQRAPATGAVPGSAAAATDFKCKADAGRPEKGTYPPRQRKTSTRDLEELDRKEEHLDFGGQYPETCLGNIALLDIDEASEQTAEKLQMMRRATAVVQRSPVHWTVVVEQYWKLGLRSLPISLGQDIYCRMVLTRSLK